MPSCNEIQPIRKWIVSCCLRALIGTFQTNDMVLFSFSSTFGRDFSLNKNTSRVPSHVLSYVLPFPPSNLPTKPSLRKKILLPFAIQNNSRKNLIAIKRPLIKMVLLLPPVKEKHEFIKEVTDSKPHSFPHLPQLRKRRKVPIRIKSHPFLVAFQPLSFFEIKKNNL